MFRTGTGTLVAGAESGAAAPQPVPPAAPASRLALDSALQQLVRAYYREENGQGICYLDRHARDAPELILNPGALLRCFEEYQPNTLGW